MANMFIIATIGYTSTSEDKITKIILAGADVLRFNFAYKLIRENGTYIRTAQRLIEELNSSTKILVDFPLNKIRLGDFDIKVFAVRENEQITFKSASYSPDCNQFLPVDVPLLGEKVYLDQTITIGDGEISMQVTEICDRNTIKVRVLNNGVINYGKTFNCGQYLSEEQILALYNETLEKISEVNPQMVSISFINETVNQKIKDIIKEKQNSTQIIIKIERDIPYQIIETICQDPFYDMILIDRGEIGINSPYEKLGILQKKVFDVAKKHKKPVIVSSQILESTIYNYIPSRSDLLDLTNIVLDGAVGIMLCMETAATSRPSYSLSVAKKIILEVERSKNNHAPT